MYKQTKIGAKHIQNILFGLAVLLILSCSAVKADTSKPTTSEVKYQRYNTYQEKKYHRFLPTPAPKGLYYNTRMAATANIDDTPEKETVVLILVDVPREPYRYDVDEWVQAFLLIANTEVAELQEKALFKLFDTGTYALEAPTAKAIELQNPPFVFTEPPKDVLQSHATFELIDLTGDGILDVWFESTYGVAVISFQNGTFKEVFGNYTIPGFLSEAEYVDLDSNGSYEIRVPYSIHIDRVPSAPHLPWMSLYEWNGNAYILNNERFYAENDEFLIALLSEYNYQMLRHGRVIYHCETYRFYLGLVSYYRSGVLPVDLKWIIEHGKTDHYIQAAESILKKLPSQ